VEEKDRKPTLDEYRGMDGLIRCRVCGEKRQHRFKLWTEERVVPCKCTCQLAEEEKVERSPFDEERQ